ncbi:uncharacterized protein LOC106866088 [Brachypodium distachyon]|uniref:LysM domain-containing protein n=1 Tax=Brachypodium distachyon TaxID=15368 RepID=I1HSA4_BRADI|nr:uncharacterized protein LOC106866088 [Brachypodium distachyon]PNT72989.1 hypothetical protein BRADI_2g51851v3 [Brachypodium distachyon]|eukprot:XP_014754133.1 uncharacterized protein LOC106866088 [Brachypodium distachyon]
MANHGAAALLLIASLLVAAAALADARITVHASAKDVPALTCNKVHEKQADETCFSMAQSAGVTQEEFLGFNPNINCDKAFPGQWVCFDASAA